MTVLIVAEKPSAARNFAKALGGMSGSFEGTQYRITALRGHLYEFAEPHEQVPAALTERYQKWDLAELPWDEKSFAWKRKPQRDTSSMINDLNAAASGASEIVCGTDLDPTGEGALLFAEPILELGIRPPKLTRMYFTDEAEASIKKAFRERKPVPGNDITRLDEYKKAITRARFDFLTQQFTRIASLSSGQRSVLRQGRLKSAMLLLIGEQLKAHNSYVKTVSYQNRFRDEHGVLFTDLDQPVFTQQAQAQAAMAQFKAGQVVVDSKTLKSTPPPKLLDLAGLSSRLAPKGFKPDEVLKIYQSMYEAQLVSYPRTEDRVITPAQFTEMLPLVDSIAGLVGVDVTLLTQRSPRSTHVKDGGAHGANRPGLKLPASMSALEGQYGKLGRAIYEELARSFLAMSAADYRYEAQVGHVEPHPTFVGRCSVPVSPGWKQVFSTGETDDGENAKGLGTRAEPCVFDVIPKRPEHPSMAWLMKQLDKWDIGTGATRTSTYSELTKAVSPGNKYPLMVDTRGRTTLTEFGEQGYRMLPGTRIGDLEATAWIYRQMKAVAEGTATTEQVIATVAEWVQHDLTAMAANAITMRSELGLKERAKPRERYSGTWKKTGTNVEFVREAMGHRFSDAECETLLKGETVTASFTGKKGPFEGHGVLAMETYKGTQRLGFKLTGFGRADTTGKVQVPDSWCGHTFTAAEKKTLAGGGKVDATDFVSKLGKPFSASVTFGDEGGRKKIIPAFAGRN